MNPLLVLALGLVVGIGAAFTGLGGGFLVVPILVFAGFAPQKAVATSFAAILLVSVSALVAHGRMQNVDWKVGLLIGLGGIVGAQAGARLLQHVSATTFNRVFGVILLALAARMLMKK